MGTDENALKLQNVLNTLGLCKKAGRMITGFDAVVADIKRSRGVIITRDLSEKSKKEMTFHCGKHNKPLLEIDCDMDDVQRVLGKRSGIISVTDPGLFKSIEGKLKGQPSETPFVGVSSENFVGQGNPTKQGFVPCEEG